MLKKKVNRSLLQTSFYFPPLYLFLWNLTLWHKCFFAPSEALYSLKTKYIQCFFRIIYFFHLLMPPFSLASDCTLFSLNLCFLKCQLPCHPKTLGYLFICFLFHSFPLFQIYLILSLKCCSHEPLLAPNPSTFHSRSTLVFIYVMGNNGST